MTLSHWWKHWFWITLPFYFVCCESSTTELSPLTQDANAFKNHTTKFITIQNPPVGSTFNKTNPIIPTKIQKTSPKKVDFIYLNMTKSNTTTIRTTIASTVSTTTVITTPIKPIITTNKNTTVIKQDDSGVIDSQLSNITLPINHTENILYTESDYNNNNQSFLFNINDDNNNNINNSYNNCSNDDDTGNLSAAGITGITLGCVVIVGVLCGISYFLYHNRGSNRPQVLNDRCSNPDSSGYIDDASVRDNSEEMYSLDNDSFLNSLEAMTIQNYWTDTVKHTKL